MTLNQVMPFCNSETVFLPVEMLTILAKANQDCTRNLSALILPHVLSLFEKYHKDAMLAEDILELIKTIASVPEN